MRIAGKILGGILGLLVATAWVFGFMMESGAVPSDRVQTHDEIGEKHMAVLLEEGIIARDERIEFFYSEGLVSVREGGSIVSDRRVMGWSAWDEDELYITEIASNDIQSVELIQEGNTFNYAVYAVTGSNADDYVELWLPHEYGDAERFVAAIEAKIR
ncbi:MAG: hypothetical protein ACE5F8_05550 [Woeseiaceae bacterium]